MTDAQQTASSDQPVPPIHFAGSELGGRHHICAFFRSPEEEYRVLLPFIKEGFERGEKAFHVVDPELRDAHRRRLESAGIDVASVEEHGQFELLDWNQYYFPDGEFDEARMMAKWDTVLEGAVRMGYPRTRVIAHLEWFQRDVNVLLQYEAKFNLVPRDRDPVICTYDLSRHSGSFILDVLRTHPMIIVGGILQENPFYVPAEQFLEELRQRRADQREAQTSAT
jgi:hypothetical protein